MRSKLPVTVYLFLALYGSTTLQSRSFLKNIENFLCKSKFVNDRSIPSTHAERKISVCSHKHSFIPYPSLSPYWQTERQTETEYTCCAWAGGFFFQLCCCVSFWFWREEGFGFTYTYVLRVQYSCDVVLVFWFWRDIDFEVTYVLSVQYSCAVVSVFWLWRGIVLKTRTHFYKKILLGYFIMIQ